MTSRACMAGLLSFFGLAATTLFASTSGAPTPGDVVIVDFVVEDTRGRPVLNLATDEVVITQDGARQRIAELKPKEAAGRYELRYAPLSGKAAAVSLKVLRPATRVRGLDGPGLKPRIVQPLSPLEAELTQILESRPDAADFRFFTSVLRYETADDGVHHTFVVEVPFASLTAALRDREFIGRIQLMAQLKNDAGEVTHRFSLDRTLSASSAAQLQAQRLVWSPGAHLRPGVYTLDLAGRDAIGDRAAIHHLSVQAPPMPPGVRVSSVTLLHPTGSPLVHELSTGADDPLMLAGEQVMPRVQLQTVAAPGVKVTFFVVVYPDRSSPEPVTLRMDLLRDDEIVGSAPIALPAPDARGEIRYAGGVPVHTFKPGEYRLRLQAQQGTTVSYEEAPFSVVTDTDAPTLQFADSTTGTRRFEKKGTDARIEAADDLANPSMLLRQQRYDAAADALEKLDKTAQGRRTDVAQLLAIAYYRLGAYKDAEAAARRVIELAKDDPRTLADTYYILGRIQADSEKKDVRRDSERLAAAVDSFRRSIDAGGGTSETAPLAAAEALYRLERIDEARQTLETLLARPGLGSAVAARAQLLLGNPRCATEICMPHLSFVTADGRRCGPEELKGKVVLLSFWATWCAPCVAATPELKRIHARYAKEPFVMVGVNLDHDKDVMAGFVEKHKVAWAQMDGEAADRVHDSMGIRGIPAELVFDHEGVLVKRTSGWGSTSGAAIDASIRDAVEKAKKAQKAAGPALK